MAVMYALAIIPVMIAAGVGIDLGRALSNRTNLQDALDATALALAHMPVDTDQAVLEQKADAWMAVNMRDSGIAAPNVTVDLKAGQIVLTATASTPTTITAITGKTEIPIEAKSTVKWGFGNIEVALVLDNTGSMQGTKLTRLKDAAAALVATLEEQLDSTKPDLLKISVVPFSTTVRLSNKSTDLNTYKAATWMSGALPSEYGSDLFVDKDNKPVRMNRFTNFTTLGQAWAGCVEMRPQPYDIQDTAPDTTKPATLFVPYFAPDEPDYEALKKSGNNNGYYTSDNDYLDDEKSDNDAKAKLGSNASRYSRWLFMQGHDGKYDETVSTSNINAGKGPNRGCKLQPLLRLTNKMQDVKDRLAAMVADGNTNIPVGLMWGWHTLSPNLPFKDGAAYDDGKTTKVIVLLTDGDNTDTVSDNPNNSYYTSAGYTWQERRPPIVRTTDADTRTDEMDKRMAKLCTNIKNAKIVVYAVRIDVSGTAPLELSQCPTDASKFYNINSTGLTAAFEKIGGEIGKLHLAQ